jgi:hypothetical protein
MQKIAIIGPGSIGIAAQMALLAPQYDVIGLADTSIHVDFSGPGGREGYGPIAMEHSFEANYKPTPKEIAWLQAQMEPEELPLVTLDLPAIRADYQAMTKEEAWRAQQPRHRSPFTKSQPSAKARKAARKRAKAGRKATR